MRSLIVRLIRGNWPIATLALASILPLFAVRFLPFFDYPHWVYQANIIAHYPEFRQWYTLNWMPVPNLGSTLPLLALTPIFGPELGAKILVAGYACGMILAFAYLARGIAGAPTGYELLGSIVVYNYFFYNGFLSYIVGLPVLLAVLGVLVRTPSQPSRAQVAIVSLLSIIAYLCHLFVWIPIVFYLMTTVFVTRTHRPILLLSQALPGFLLLAYVLQKRDSIPTQYYDSLANKLFSIVGPNLPFQRVDPFAAPIPILLLNIVILSFIGLLFIRALYKSLSGNAPPMPVLGTDGRGQARKGSRLEAFLRVGLRSSASHSASSLLIVCIGLLVAAVTLPFTWFGGMGAVDQRFVFTAYVILLAGLGAAATTRFRQSFAMPLALSVLLAHTIAFIAAGNQLRMVHDAIRARPRDASVFVAALRHPPMYGSCESPNILNAGSGIFALQWFPLYDAVERGGAIASSFGTAALQPASTAGYPMAFGQFQTEEERNRLVVDSADMSNTYDYLFLFGCPQDVHPIEAKLRSRFVLVDEGRYYAIIKLRDSS
jgi:hypothetical protein